MISFVHKIPLVTDGHPQVGNWCPSMTEPEARHLLDPREWDRQQCAGNGEIREREGTAMYIPATAGLSFPFFPATALRPLK